MGKQRFRLSHMIPNAWFYRLRDMNTSTHNKKPLPSAYSSTPNSFCYTPRLYPYNNNSPTNTINNPAVVSIYTSPTELTHNTHHQHLFPSPTSSTSYHESPFSESTRSLSKPPSTSYSCGVISSSTTTTDVVIEYFNEKSYTKKIQDSSGYELLQKPPPIITKSNNDKITMVEKKEETSNIQSSISIKIVEESISKKENPVSGVEIRSNASRTPVCKRIVDVNNDQKNSKKNNMLSSSCCIVKSSFDPQKDFKESMVEMIVEDKIWDSKDLEKLLASYLSLNSNEYHEMIIKAFEEIWLSFEFVD